MTRILVVTASRHGSTTGIGQALQRELRRLGLDASLAEADSAPDPSGFDAVVLGSAVYVGRWMDAMKAYVARHQAALAQRPVFLFSSGPLGDAPDEDPVDAAAMVAQTSAREHVVFAGALDRSKLGLVERAMARAVKAPEGDFRPWARIEAWARHVADALPAPEKTPVSAR